MDKKTEKLIEAARDWFHTRQLVFSKMETGRVNLKDPRYDLGDREAKLTEAVIEYEETNI